MENKIMTAVLVITILIGIISIGYLVFLILKTVVLDERRKSERITPILPSAIALDINEISVEGELNEATVSLQCAMQRRHPLVKLQFKKIADKPCERIEFLSKETTVIGRKPDVDIFIKDSMISRYHLKLSFLNCVLQIQDLGTTNGTYLNGSRLTPMSSVPVSSESIVDIGRTSFAIYIE